MNYSHLRAKGRLGESSSLVLKNQKDTGDYYLFIKYCFICQICSLIGIHYFFIISKENAYLPGILYYLVNRLDTYKTTF